MVIPWHLVLFGWITGCSEVKLPDNSGSSRNIHSSSGNRDISSADNGIASPTGNNGSSNQRPPSASTPHTATLLSPSKSKKAKTAPSSFVIPEMTQAPHGVLATTLLVAMLCDRCLKNKVIFTLDLEPGVKEFTSKMSKLTSTKLITIKRALDSFLMLVDTEEPYWVMSPLRVRCLESSLPFSWSSISKNKIYKLMIDLCQIDASIDAKGKKGNHTTYE